MADRGSPIAKPDGRPSVMIVDDDAEMRALLRDALERDGFGVRERPSGDELVPFLERCTPDAIVLDKEMTGVNGLDLLSYIRQRHPSVPVIFVTAFGGAEVESEALKLGAAYYMDKPFRVARLIAVLRAAVGGTGLERGPSGRVCAVDGDRT